MSQKSQNTSVAASSTSGFTATHSRTNSHTSSQSSLVEGEQQRISKTFGGVFRKTLFRKNDSILNNATLKALKKRQSELHSDLRNLQPKLRRARDDVLKRNTQVSNKALYITRFEAMVAKAGDERTKKKAEELVAKTTLDSGKLKNHLAEAVARVAQLAADETTLKSEIKEATKAINDAEDKRTKVLMQFEAQNQAYIGGLIVATSGEQGTIATDNPGFADMNDFEGLL
jgi:chromosome segregation ATPase